MSLAVGFLVGLASGLVGYLISDRLVKSSKIILAIAVLSGLAGFIIAWIWLYPPAPVVSVPDITGQYEDVARRTLAETGLQYVETDKRYDNRAKERQIVSQNPAGGVPVVKGTGVAVIVSKGPRRVPDVIGERRADAFSLLRNAGLTSIRTRNEYSDDPRGTVIGQSPPAGRSAESGTLVSLEISSGPRPQATATPSVHISELQSGQGVEVKILADGTYHFSVHGVSQGMNSTSGLKLLLWARPVDPPPETSGWYLQRPPGNGIPAVQSDGNWEGVGQLGNPQWPPHAGDTFDIAVTVVDTRTASDLTNQTGVVTRDDLAAISRATAEARNLIVRF